MRLFLNRFKAKCVPIESCKRWSVLASFLLYVFLFTLVKLLEVPLKSDDEAKSPNRGKPFGNNNIIEYLHRLHTLKMSQGIADGGDDDREQIQSLTDLEEIFHKADYNQDNYLSVDEVSKWINAKTQEHIREAIVENYKMFVAIDVRPKDGFVSWKEYHDFFLEKNGLNKSYIAGHSEKHRDLARTMKVAIMKDQVAWSECARTDPDHLNLDEFLSFRHPESSHSTIISLVDEIYKKFDRDGDDILTEEEFSTLQTEDEYGKSEAVSQEEKERRREFQEMVDLDKDGKATRKEMMTYIDPKNPRHAKEEAEVLMGLADADRDGLLSLLEVFNKMDLFLGSKMVDTARSFHDEF